MNYVPSVFLCVNLLVLVCNIEAVTFSSLCKLDDSACITKTTQDFVPIFAKGIPELGVDPIDPMHIKFINASVPGLKLLLKDITLTGLKDANVKSIKFIDESKGYKVMIKLVCTLKLESMYDMAGNLLFVPMEGNGKLHGILRDLEISIVAGKTDVVGSDGETYWKELYRSHTYTPKSSSDFEFENLFNGNPALNAISKEVISRSGNTIVTEIGPPVVRAVIDEVFVCIGQLVQKIPAKDLYLM